MLGTKSAPLPIGISVLSRASCSSGVGMSQP
jgi:hypothetical protein